MNYNKPFHKDSLRSLVSSTLGGIMTRNQILDELIRLRDAWYATEKATDEVVWGECAYDIDRLIENAADKLQSRSNADYCPMCDSFNCICTGC